MSLSIVLRDSAQEKKLLDEAFPYTLGGAGANVIPLPGWINASPAATLYLSESGVAIESSAPDVPLSINRKRFPGRVALVDGDVVRIGEDKIEVRVADQVELILTPSVSALPPPAAPLPPPIAAKDRHSEPLENVSPSRPAASVFRRWVSRFLFLLLLAMGAMATYVILGKRVAIVVTPSPDKLELAGGWIRPKIRSSWLLLRGRYQVSAELEGYHPLKETVIVSDGSDQTFRLKMRKLPGRLNLRVHRRGRPAIPIEAAVQVDGNHAGQSPLSEFRIEPGPHEIVLTSPRYESMTTNITVEGRNRLLDIMAEMKPSWAEVRVQSDPPEAHIELDGQPVGKTVAELEIPEGRHTLRLTLPLHEPAQTSLTFKADTRVELPVFRLEWSPGIFELETDPAGASITVNGEYIGQTPLRAQLKPRQTWQVAVSHNGFKEEEFSLAVEPGERVQRRVELSPILGEVHLVGLPTHAEVRVNGEKWSGNQPMQLPSDTAKLEILCEGYEPWVRTVTPRPKFPIEVRVEMQRKGPPPPAPEKSSVASALGIDMIKFSPGEFSMGSSRREQGRRSNEPLRKVRLTRPFAISKTEIPNEVFKKFRATHRSGAFGGNTLDSPSQPVVDVSWGDAAAFCNWLSEQEGLSPAYVEKAGKWVPGIPMTNGYRLPTEAEWEYCARLGSPLRTAPFPWGNAFPPPAKTANIADAGARSALGYAVDGYVDGFVVTAPVGKFTPSSAGLLDIAGNVAEWCHDFYHIPTSVEASAILDPIGPADGTHHVIRGSSWRTMLISELRVAFRDYGDQARNDLGFRIARTLEEPEP